MSEHQQYRPRSSTASSVKEYIKRKREEESINKEEERIFQRSKLIVKSPNKATEVINREESMDELKEMMANLTRTVRDSIEENKKESRDIKDKLIAMETRWNDKVHEMEQTIEILQEKTDKQGEKIVELEKQLERGEKEKRRDNIIIKNLPTTEGVTREKVEEFLKQKMQVRIEVVDAFNIGRNADKQVIVARLKNFQQKRSVMENKYKLKGTRIYIESDLTGTEKEIQNQIWAIAKKEMEKGERVKVGYQKLIKQNECYVWDKKNNDLKPDSKKPYRAKN